MSVPQKLFHPRGLIGRKRHGWRLGVSKDQNRSRQHHTPLENRLEGRAAHPHHLPSAARQRSARGNRAQSAKHALFGRSLARAINYPADSILPRRWPDVVRIVTSWAMCFLSLRGSLLRNASHHSGDGEAGGQGVHVAAGAFPVGIGLLGGDFRDGQTGSVEFTWTRFGQRTIPGGKVFF
jgi:hypothetical protein